MTVFLAVLFTVNNTFSSFQVHDFSRGMVGIFCAVNTVNTLLMARPYPLYTVLCKEKRLQSQIHSSGRIFQGSGRIYQQNQFQPSMGICGKRNSG